MNHESEKTVLTNNKEKGQNNSSYKQEVPYANKTLNKELPLEPITDDYGDSPYNYSRPSFL